MKKNIVLFVLFILPIVAYLFFASGVNNFDKLDYVLDTKSVLIRSANWLAQGYVLRKIQESCRYSIKPNLEEGKQNVMQYLTNYSPMKGVFVNGTLADFEFQRIELTNKAILAFIKTSGQVDVKIDGME